MTGLVLFQFKWIQHSRHLAEEIFHQRASMALCSTLEEYGDGAICTPSQCAVLCGDGVVKETTDTSRQVLLDNELFQADLRRTLDFYNIHLPFQLAESGQNPAQGASGEAAGCVVNLPAHVDRHESFISLTFPDKDNYMFAGMKFMITATILILFFTALVLWVANWWLHKQRKLLRLNVEMYNNMAHEFRTPLTNIQLASNMLLKHTNPEQSSKCIDIIRKENTRLIQQVEKVLHLARMDKGEYDLQSEKVQVAEILRHVVEELDIQIAGQEAQVILEPIPQQFELAGDRHHLGQVFRNLIDNALKYAGDKPVIHITAREEKEQIVISVQDNGKGIPPEKSKIIFDSFSRIEDAGHSSQKGFGLGLAYVKRIIELHHGRVQLDRDVIQGCRFNVFLPKWT